MHLDLRCDDADIDASRLVALGARVAPDQSDETFIVMRDPEGNEFCLLRS